MKIRVSSRRIFIQAVIAVLGVLSLGGCAFSAPPAPDDLKFVSIKAVDSNALSDSVQYDIRHHKFNTLPRKLLEVTFSSEGNISEYRKKWGDTYIETVFCQRWKDKDNALRDSS